MTLYGYQFMKFPITESTFVYSNVDTGTVEPESTEFSQRK